MGLAPRPGVDNGAPCGVVQDVEHLRQFLGCRTNHILQVGTRETAFEDLCARTEIEACLNIFGHFGRGGGCQGQTGHIGTQQFAQFADKQIRRTEVIAPLRDAMRLIHHKQRDVEGAQFVAKPLPCKSFGRHIEEFAAVGGQAFAGFAGFRRGHSGM